MTTHGNAPESPTSHRPDLRTPDEPAPPAPLAPQRSTGGRIRGQGRDRVHASPRRGRALLLRYTDTEYTDVATAARLTGLTATGFVAETALAAARRIDGPSTAPTRAALLEVMAARTQVRRFAVNVNQAVAALNGTGKAPVWLADAVRAATRAVTTLDQTAQHLADTSRPQAGRRLPPRPEPHQPTKPRCDGEP